MFKVWILVFYMGGSYGGGPAVIDNIVSVKECQRIQSLVNELNYGASSRCIEGMKVRPNGM